MVDLALYPLKLAAIAGMRQFLQPHFLGAPNLHKIPVSPGVAIPAPVRDVRHVSEHAVNGLGLGVGHAEASSRSDQQECKSCPL